MTDGKKLKINIDGHEVELEKNSTTVQFIAETMKTALLLQHGQDTPAPVPTQQTQVVATVSSSPGQDLRKLDFSKIQKEPPVPEQSADYDKYLREIFQHACPKGEKEVCTLLAWLAINWGKHENINGDLIRDYMGRVGHRTTRKNLDQLIRDTKSTHNYFDKGKGRKNYIVSSMGNTFVESQLLLKPPVKKDDKTKDK